MSNRWWIRLAPWLSGAMMALAFPVAGQGWLAWVALVPLISVIHHRPWRAGLNAGVVFFAVVLYWLNIVMTTYGHLPWLLSVAAYLMLVLYLAGFWGAACWAAVRISRRLGLSLILVLPVVWLVTEFVRSWLLTGFPWAALAYSQADYPRLIQSVDLWGIYGLIYLLLLVNCVIARSWQSWQRCQRLPWRWLALTLVLWLANVGYGHWRLTDEAASGEPLRVALVQGNIDQAIKWDAAFLQQTLDRYRQLSAQADKPDLLVWPESATPFFYQDGGSRAYQVRSVAREGRARLLFGSPSYVGERNRYRYFNSAYLLSAEGQEMGRSDKVHLVPFGEYVPLWGMFGLVEKLADGVGDFIPGSLQPVSVNGHQVGVLICYEAIFPELARTLVGRGAGLLVNLTNDAWFGRSSAPWQHLAMTRFRAIENRVWIARCANTGISALIDPRGNVVRQSALFEPALVEGTAHFQQGGSLYTRTGDSVPLLLSAVVLVWLWQSRKKKLSSAAADMSL